MQSCNAACSEPRLTHTHAASTALPHRPRARHTQDYLRELVQALSEAPRWGGGVVRADALVINQLSDADSADNFLVYAVASELMQQATYHHTMDRCDQTALCEADDPAGLASMTRLRDEAWALRMQRARGGY